MKLRRFLRQSQRGTVLMTVLILLITGSIVAIGLVQYMFAMIRLDERRADGLKAFYIAESGVNRVVDFFNHPDQYPDGQQNGGLAMLGGRAPGLSMAGLGLDLTSGARKGNGAQPLDAWGPRLASAQQAGGVAAEDRLFYFDEETGTFPNIETQLQQGNITLDNSIYPSFNGNQGGLFGHVENIQMAPPENGDPSNCFARMTSTGVTHSGVRKTVSVFLLAGNPAASSPAALISKKDAELSGNVSVKWGEVWIKEDGELPNWSKWSNYVDTSDNDWTFIRCNANLSMGKNKNLDGSKNGSKDPITNPDDPRYTNPCKEVSQLDEYDGRILMNQNLQFPEFDYEAYKTLALRRGDYYYTGSGGKLYRRDGSQVNDIKAELFNADPANPDNRFVFVDTIDKQAPKANGSNLATFKLSGGSPHSQGLYYLNVNLDISGVGNPPSMTVKDPDGTPHNLPKVFHAGIIYISGDLDGTGNAVIYGSVIAERGITGSGTPTVYYDQRLKDATYMPLNSLVSVRLYDIR